MTDLDKNRIRELKQALAIAIEALEEHIGRDDSPILKWLKDVEYGEDYDRAQRDALHALLSAPFDNR